MLNRRKSILKTLLAPAHWVENAVLVLHKNKDKHLLASETHDLRMASWLFLVNSPRLRAPAAYRIILSQGLITAFSSCAGAHVGVLSLVISSSCRGCFLPCRPRIVVRVSEFSFSHPLGAFTLGLVAS